jgi:hypothetical protein
MRKRSPSADCTVCERQHVSRRRLDELCGGAQLVARTKERAHHHPVDVGFDGQRLDVGASPANRAEPSRSNRTTTTQCGKRRRDGVRQAEGEKVEFRDTGRSTRNGSTTTRVSV